MLRDRIIISFFVLALVLALLSLGVISLGLRGENGPFIIHYNQEGQVDFSGDIALVYGILGVALVIFLINFFLAYEIYNRERFLSYILAAGSFFVAVLTIILSWTIISVN